MDYINLIIDYGIIALISAIIAGGIIVILYKRLLPTILNELSHSIIETIGESFKQTENQKLSVASRMDNTLKKKLADDLTDPANPIGAVLDLLPQTREHIKKHPDQIGGLINLANTIPSIFNLVNQVRGLTSKKQTPEDDFNKGLPK